MADGQAQVPERIEERVQEPLVVGSDGPGEEHQQVDVRVQAELAAAVAAEREHRDRLRGRRRPRRTAAGRARPCGASTAAAPGARLRRGPPQSASSLRADASLAIRNARGSEGTAAAEVGASDIKARTGSTGGGSIRPQPSLVW